MATQVGAQYLQDLSYHYKACETVTEDFETAVTWANQISNPKIQDKAKSELVGFGTKKFGKDEAKMARIVALVATISSEAVQSKCAARILKRVEITAIQTAIREKFPLKMAEERTKSHAESDASLLAVIDKTIAEGNYKVAIWKASLLLDPGMRLGRLQRIATVLPAGFSFPDGISEETQKNALSQWQKKLSLLQAATPEEIDKCVTELKDVILRATATGIPAFSIKLAAIAREHLQAQGIENALHRAATVAATYNIDTANNIAALLRIPKRMQACREQIDTIHASLSQRK